jgi:PAS domain S-box-containing protein
MTPVEYRERLYAALGDSNQPVEARIDRALEIGVEYLGLPIGFCTRIEADVQEIVHATGTHDLIQPGETCPLEDAYCRRTVEIESPLAIQDADASSAISDSAVETFGLGAYIGARIVVQDETWGTICFAATETRDREFSDAEGYFVELAARLLGQVLEQQSYEREIQLREQEVNTKEEVYRAVVDASFDLVFQIGPDGRFTYVSETIEDLLGYTAEDYLGEPFVSLLPDQETVEIAEEVYEAVMQGETVEREYFPLEHETTERVLVDIRVTPLYSGEVPPEERTPADIVGVQGMARDARDRQRRQRIISILNRVLRHNLRNDMGVISGYANILQDRLTDENATYARKIGETSDRLITLSETARKFEENIDTPPELDTVDIVPTVREVASQIEERYSDATVTVTTPESAVANSAPRLEIALWELLDNAAKHSGEDPSIAISVQIADTQAVIRVADDGPGLPENERDVLVSGDETPLVHGSGLGLWLVYWIVESIGGMLTVHDSEGRTCIEIALERTA